MLVDVTRFRHSPGEQVGLWRDEHIIPRYNAAGGRKFAFLVPPRAPGTVENGSEPAREPFVRVKDRPARSYPSESCLRPPTVAVGRFRSIYRASRRVALASQCGQQPEIVFPPRDRTSVTCQGGKVMPHKSSQAAGPVIEPDRPHKSLHVLGRRLKTKVLVTGLKAATTPDPTFKIGVGARAPRRVRFRSASSNFSCAQG
jgi:hypothetical protein